MGVMIFRPGQRLVIPGVQVYQPRPSAAAANWWDVAGQTCVAAYQPKGASSLAASYTNLTGNATYNAAPGVAPTWDVTGGWTFDGSSQYLMTGVVVSTNNYSILCRYSNMGPQTAMVVAAGLVRLEPNYSDGNRYYEYGGYTGGPSGASSGVMGLGGLQGYFNGSPDFGAISPGTLPAVGLYIGARNNAGAPANYANVKIQAVAIYSTTLSAGNVASLTTAMNLL